MTRLRAVAIAVGLGLLAACGDDPTAGGTTSVELQARVAEIRELAEARDPAGVAAELSDLRLTVEDLRNRGELDDERADAILGAAQAVETQLALITTTTTTSTTSTTAAPPPPKPDGEDNGKGRNKDEDEDD